MFEVKGLIFKETNGKTQGFPFDNMTAASYEEVHEVMQAMNIPYYIFILKEVK